MISSRYLGSIRLHFLLKLAVATALFWALFWALVWLLHLGIYQSELLPENYLWVSLLIPAAALIEIVARDKRQRSLCGLSRTQIWSITQREILFALVAIFGVIVMSKDGRLSRAFLATFFGLYSGWIAWMNLVGHRLLHRHLCRSARKTGNTVVLAPPREIERDTALHMTATVPGAEVLGYVSYGSGAVSIAPDYPILGSFEDIREICRSCHARLLMALGLDHRPDLVRGLQQICDSLGMRLIWVDDKREHFSGRMDAHQSGSRLLLTNWHEPLEDPLSRALKRGFDLAFSAVIVLTILPPLCLIVWLLHRIYSPGPLFYRQARTGRNGEVFQVFKFRTMHQNATPGVQARQGDARIFPGAAFLRRSSIDEFPQFLNVLSGEMSVVGPRPHFVEHDVQFAGYADDYSLRHFAKPGVTGLAQVKGCRGETDTPLKVRQRVRFDRFYLRHWSPMLDLAIVCETAAHVIFPPKSAR